MNGKIILCLAAVLVGQTMSSSLFDGEEFKKLGEQFALSTVNVINHVSKLTGTAAINSADPQKYFEKAKELFSQSVTEMETGATKLRDTVRKNLDTKTNEKLDEIEKEIKKQAAQAKQLFEDKVAKPINDKYKDDVKKAADNILKATKDYELTVTTAIDNIKKP